MTTWCLAHATASETAKNQDGKIEPFPDMLAIPTIGRICHMSLLLKGCQIIDATLPEVRWDWHVLVEGDTIKELGGGRLPAADRILDLEGAYLLPGLWDVHTHLRTTTWTGPSLPQDPVEAIFSYGWCAMEALQAGVTAMRVVGIPYWADVAWRQDRKSVV